MIDRRKFIKSLSSLGISLALLRAKSFTNTAQNKKMNSPIILCSRGKDWAENVLKPGWDILRKNGSLLDAIEKSARLSLIQEIRLLDTVDFQTKMVLCN